MIKHDYKELNGKLDEVEAMITSSLQWANNEAEYERLMHILMLLNKTRAISQEAEDDENEAYAVFMRAFGKVE